jgi:hypothetical protein
MRYLFALMLVVLFCCAQVAAQEKPVAVLSLDRQQIDLRFESGKVMPEKFAQNLVGNLANYKLVELEPVDDAGAISKDRTAWIAAAPPPECAGFNCERIKLRLTRPLDAGQSFILAISDFTNDAKPVTVRFAVAPPSPAPEKAEISIGPDVYNQRSQLMLTSKTPIAVTPQVNVQRIFFTFNKDGTDVVQNTEVIVADVSKLTDARFILNLNGKLIEGQEHSFFIAQGIQDALGHPVRAEGKVKLAGIPAKPEEMMIDLNLAAVSAVKQKAVFDLTAKYNPLRIEDVFGTEWLWEPTVNIDVGLRSTKSNNSVILAPLNFSNVFLENAFPPGGRKKPPVLGQAGQQAAASSIPIYSNWASTPWYRLSDIKFTVGPKAEFDRQFRRKNILGSVRFDFNFHRWKASRAARQNMIKFDKGPDIATALRLNYGWEIVPYAVLDFGGRVNDETVTNKGKNANLRVPKFKILRSYFGVVMTYEINRFSIPIKITVDESLVYLASRETIGLVTDTGVGLRVLRGFHHRGKASVNFAFDPAGHYSFNVTYENGRLAPNFEYLNKLTGGIRIVY